MTEATYHNLIGTKSLVELLLAGTLKFVLMPTQDVILYRNPIEANGILNSIYFSAKDGGELTGEEFFDQQIRRILKPASGGDAQTTEAIYQLIRSSTVFYERREEGNIKGIVGGLLLRKSMRTLIGMSEGTSLDALPRWTIYPVLRLAYVVRAGVTCQLLRIASTKLEYGESQLAGPAFAASSGTEWADGMASYVATGRFDSDLGVYNLRDSRVLDAILEFRNGPNGLALRKEILENLALRRGSDVVTSINATLKAAIPSIVLQQAHDQMSSLLIASGAVSAMAPALWNNANYANKALALWRKQSAAVLTDHCRKAGLRMHDFCPCASGEKLKFCCAESLEVELD